jgi:tetratricopeptide (TPR) repeat protein
MASRKGSPEDPIEDQVRRRILPPDDDDEDEKLDLRGDRREARRNGERLRVLPYREQTALVEKEEALQSWALAELLCDDSAQAVAEGRAADALQCAKVALRIAGLAREGESWRARLESYAWSHLANAHRALSDLREAEETFRHAEVLWMEGAASQPGPLDSARSLRLESLLRKAQKRFKEGLDLLSRAQTIAQPAEELVIRIQKGAFLGISDRWSDAVRELLRAGSALNARHPPRLRLDFTFNLLVCLIHSGNLSEAEKILGEARKLAETQGTAVDRTRLRWQEARIAAGLQRTQAARTAFIEARHALAAHGLPYDAALATFELAALHAEERAEQGHAAEVKELARELASLTGSAPVETVARESQATIKLFCRLIEKDSLDPQQVRRFAEDFRRTAGDPSLRLEIGPLRED